MDWNPDCLERSPMFEPLRAGAPARGAHWPGHGELQHALEARVPPVSNARGMPLRVVPPGPRRGGPAEKYEARIFLEGALPVRPGDWHDYFNVLAWLSFPRTKAALNARHHAELGRQRAAGERNRGPTQDALTLFDEGGVIAAASDDRLLALLREWRWKELFWERRAQLAAHMRFFVFGHALYEKALQPFPGITGRGILLEVAPRFPIRSASKARASSPSCPYSACRGGIPTTTARSFTTTRIIFALAARGNAVIRDW
jgi:hypothetical protein